MNVMLSINPKYAKEICNGLKRYEYRKMRFSHPVKDVYLYVTRPIQSVVAVFHCNGIIYQKPLTLWQQTSKYTGLTRDDYFSYYSNSKIATALKIGKVRIFKKPLKLSHYGIKRPPFSFQYIK